MTLKPPSLAQLQDMFQRAILTGDNAELLRLVPDNGRTTEDVLFGVYEHAYVARLSEVLSNEHEFLKSYMGSNAFEDMARAYVAAHPSNTSNARWFACRLPEFLAKNHPFADHTELTELADLERALNDSFDATDAPTLDLAALSTYDPDKWSSLVFTPHPSARRLLFKTNAMPIWSALKAESKPPKSNKLQEPQHILVWRQDCTSMVRSLTPEEAMMWDEAAKGVPFGRLCELIAHFDNPDTAALRAAQHLQTWLSSEALTQVHLDDPHRKSQRKRVLTN